MCANGRRRYGTLCWSVSISLLQKGFSIILLGGKHTKNCRRLEGQPLERQVKYFVSKEAFVFVCLLPTFYLVRSSRASPKNSPLLVSKIAPLTTVSFVAVDGSFTREGSRVRSSISLVAGKFVENSWKIRQRHHRGRFVLLRDFTTNGLSSSAVLLFSSRRGTRKAGTQFWGRIIQVRRYIEDGRAGQSVNSVKMAPKPDRWSTEAYLFRVNTPHKCIYIFDQLSWPWVCCRLAEKRLRLEGVACRLSFYLWTFLSTRGLLLAGT